MSEAKVDNRLTIEDWPGTATPILEGAEADEYLKTVNEQQDARKTKLHIEVGNEYTIVETRTIIRGVHFRGK